ncbi:MAG TPA: transketolase [Streptosporangiaceae bacterium]|nr:transketolase [Streptosporangiaceae bacterium]
MSNQPNHSLSWTPTDARAVDLIRVLAMDAVQKAGSGHPGTAMSLAPAAYVLFQHVLRHDPADTDWAGRDRFLLSAGHSSLTLYIQLYLSGYGMTLEDLEKLRTWGSRTPGHPERHHTPGVEVTTGPLGQGLANGVGMAMAARRVRGLLDPEAAAGTSPFDHHVYVIASDGDIEEGITHEASAIAGHQQLGNLVVIYDDNDISIEDDTAIAKSEDVCARYEAYGWHVQQVTFRGGLGGSSPRGEHGRGGLGGSSPRGEHGTPGGYHEDVQAFYQALLAARDDTAAPSLIALSTIIGWPAPNKQNTGAAHGSALGADEVAATKRILRFDPEVSFPVEERAVARAREVAGRGREAHARWDERLSAWAAAQPERKALFDRLAAGRLPEGWTEALPVFEPSEKGVATRKASGEVLNALAPVLPELWGGSADLAGSNDTTMAGEPSFIPPEHQTKMFPGNIYGRTLHFGIREHAMGAILNGIAADGLTRAYGGTFLTFSDYMRGAVRLAAVSEIGSIFIWTHDSIGLGEDGPTHQPVEHLWALRAIPRLAVVRPADANETAVAWRTILERPHQPVGLCLTRQNVPVFDRSGVGRLASADGAARGGYVLAEAEGAPAEVILIGTGSEVQIALAGREALRQEGIAARVVSMPCVEWFAEQDASYQEEVLPAHVRARVSVEAGVALGWRGFVGDAGECVSLEHFGESADYQTLYREFGFTTEHVVAAAKASLARLGHKSGDPRS